MKILSIGSIVKVKNNEKDLFMIVSRFPITNLNGKTGYFEYGACLYPRGIVDSNQLFFNSENIEQIIFEGYTNEMEENFKKRAIEEIPKFDKPRFEVE